MKYLEELIPSNVFSYQDKIFIVTIDFKFKQDKRYLYCICLSTGSGSWLEDSLCVDDTELYTIDKDKNIVAIKPHLGYNDDTKNQNIS